MADVKNYPPYLDHPKERKKQTNADKYFRNATDEELLDFVLNKNHWCCHPFEACGSLICRKCWLDWLKQEVSDD